MKPKYFNPRRNLFGTAIGCASIIVTFSSVQAASIYWDGAATAGWDAVANWSTVDGATTPDPTGVPGASDEAIFNTTGVNGNETVNLNANQLVSKLTFTNTGTTLLQGGGTNRTLGIGAGGISMAAGAGAASIGSAVTNQNVTTTLTASQTWQNNSTNAVTFAQNFTTSAGVNITKTGTGNVAMSNTANNTAIAGLLDLQAGKIQTAGDFFMNGGLTGAGTLENGGTASKWTFVSTGNDISFGGTIQGNPAAPTTARLGLVKRGIGMLTLTGSNTVADNFNVENGTVRLTGTHNVGYVGGGQATVGSVNNQSGILLVDGATINATKNSNPSFAIGTTAGSRGVVKMNTGTLNSSLQLNVGNGNGAGSYAALSMSGGVINVGSWLVVGAQNDRAVLNQSGGSIVETTNRMTIGAGGNGSIGVSNHSGGSLTIAAGANTGIFLGENGTGMLNLSGTADINLQTNGAAASGTLVFGNNASSLAGTLNLNGGTLTTKEFVKGASTAGAVYRINFNGTTIKPNAANVNFLNDLANTLGYVNTNGAVFDTNGFSTTVNMPLRAPTGSGVSAIAVSAGGSGYLDTPLVTITGGTGTGAQAIAVVSPYVMTNGVVTSGGVLTGFVITNPGVGYAPGDVLTVSLTGGGPTVAATPGAVTLASNTSGGLTKTGTGVLTIGGINTYTGATNITGGALATGFTGDLNTSSGININGTGAKLIHDGSTNITTPVAITNGTLDGTGTLSTVNVANSPSAILTHGDGTGNPITIGALNFADAATINLNVTSTLAEVVTTTLNSGAAGGGKVTINASNVSWPPGAHELITYTGAIGGGGFAEFQKGTISGLSVRQSAVLSNPTGKIVLTITGDNPVWTGAFSGNWTTDPITNPKNWNLITSGAHTDYVNGDIVLFDDGATNPNVNISTANVSPLTTTFNNFGLDYNISSTGGFGIAGGSVILNGGGSVALSSANTYPGGTTLNAGTLRINNASAIGTGPLTIASAGTNIDNTSGGAINLTTVNAQNWNADFTFLGSNNLGLGTGAVALNDNRTVTVVGPATLGVGGVISGNGFALNKAGTGTLALSGASTYTGQTNVNGGTLLLTGSINAANAANVGAVSVGTGADNSILRITGGTLNATSTAVPGVAAGKSAGGSGAIIVDSGTLAATSELQLGTVASGNGSLTINGGNVSFGNWISVGRDGNGVMNMSGGTLNVTTQNITEGSFAAGYGVVTLSGGTTNITSVAASQGNYYVGEAGTGILTVSGGAALNVAGALGVRLALNGATSSGVVNLNGGTTTTPAVTKGAGTGIINFNGGTLKATASNAAFMSGLTSAYIYGSGATINNNGAAIGIDQPLLAPTGNGLSASGLVVAGSGFISPPQIRISGGGGIGATAIANLDGDGNLTGITITNPGTGYTSDPLFDVVGGGGSGTVTGSPVLVANTGGGLTVNGAGSVSLTGVSTYPGATTVAGGTLALTGTGSVNSSSGITVNGAGAKLLQTSTTAITQPVTLTSGALDGVGSVSSVSVASGAGNTVSNGNGGSGVLTVGSLAFADAATVNVNVSSTSPGIATTTLNSGAAGAGKVTVNASKTSWNNGTVYNLISYSTLTGGFGEFTKGTITGLTSRQTATLTNPAGNVALSIVGDAPVWTGAFDGTWTTAAVTSPKNWKLITGGTPTDFVTADTALFDDTATGTTSVQIAENVNPTSVIFNNTAAKTYSLASGGGFGIIGTGFLTVNGTGSVALGTANTYSGGTFLNAGTLNLNNASAIGTGLLTVTGGALDSNGVADVTLTTNNPATLSGDFSFTGTRNLALGTGNVTLAGAGTVRTVNVLNNRLSIGGLPVANGYGISKVGPGTLAINGTGVSTISGDLDVSAGVFEIGAQNFTASGLSGTGTVIDGSATNSALVINNTAAKTFPGSLQNGAGVGQLGLTKQGTGSLTLTGTSNVGAEVRVEGGVLNINGGSLTATKNTKPSISVASTAGSRGFLKMASGSITTTNELNIGSGAGAVATMPYGAMTVSGGTVTSGSWLVVAQNNDRAILNQTGGSITVSTNRMTIGAGGNNAFGVANLSGGSFNNSVGIFLGENGNGILNISGTASPNIGNMQYGGNATSLGGTLNLLGGGTLNTGSVTKGASTAGAVYLWNFNGGTLKATGNNATYFADLANTTAYVNSGGAVIDDNGFAVTIGEPLLAPTGSGVSSITVATGGSGYIDTPFVSITGGSGSGATATANVSGGVVTGFTITNPGVGYAPGDVLTATLFGGGATVDATVSAVNIAANTSGGLTKNGGGTVTLTGLNTYTGDTVVNNGLLSIATNGTLADTADVRLSSTATLNLTFGGTDTVDEFFLNNVQQVAGEWGAIGSGAAHTSAQITGTGRILVTSGGVSDPYTTWANSFPGLTDKTPGADFDKDGFTNLMEFILGGNPTISSQSIAPTQVLTPTTLVFSFKRSDESEAPTTTQTVETSTNLSNWASSVIPPIVVGAANSSGAGYTVTVTENGTAPDDVTVTINRGANTSMFARLRANKP